MGVVPPESLASSQAPFADAAAIIFGGNWYLVISLAASIVCLGTLNAWVLTSGQIALGAATDGHLPELFGTKNAQGAPKWALTISSLGMLPVLLVTLNHDLIAQVNFIIDISVTAVLFLYVMSVASYLKLFWRGGPKPLLIGTCALAFCGWALYSSGLKMIGFAACITLAGLPIYLWRTRTRLLPTAEEA
jgi:APA family basic amino acid/polyamine antiporter